MADPNQGGNACPCPGCILIIAGIVLVSIGLSQKMDDDSSNEYRQILLNNMTKECYADEIINQTSCSYDYCHNVCSYIEGSETELLCHEVCDTYHGDQVYYTAYAPNKCGIEEELIFQDSCKQWQRSLHHPFTCHVENCSSKTMYVYDSVDIPDEQNGAMNDMRDGCICFGVGVLLCCTLICNPGCEQTLE